MSRPDFQLTISRMPIGHTYQVTIGLSAIHGYTLGTVGHAISKAIRHARSIWGDSGNIRNMQGVLKLTDPRDPAPDFSKINWATWPEHCVHTR